MKLFCALLCRIRLAAGLGGLCILHHLSSCATCFLCGEEIQDKVSVSDDDGVAAAEQSDPIVIDCKATVREQVNGLDGQSFLFANVELGSMEVGKKYKINVKIFNQTETAIKFSRVSATCGCARVLADCEEIPAFGDGSVTLEIDVPNINSGQSVGTRVSVGAAFLSPNAKNPVLRLAVFYEVASAFRFAMNRVNVDVPEGEIAVRAKIPVAISPPLTADMLELKKTENFRDLAIEFVRDGPDGPHVHLTVLRQNLPRNGMVGELFLARPGTKLGAGTLVIIRHQKQFTIHPESLRLARDDQSQPFQATALLRIAAATQVDGPPALEAKADVQNADSAKNADSSVAQSAPKHGQPEVALKIGGHSAEVQLQRLGQSNVYRINISYKGPVDTAKVDGTLDVQWRVFAGGRESVVEAHAFLSEGIHRSQGRKK